MSIEEKQTCNMHTKEKEKSGTCCQTKDEEEKTEEEKTLFIANAQEAVRQSSRTGSKLEHFLRGTIMMIKFSVFRSSLTLHTSN